jgi:hypothetical protein
MVLLQGHLDVVLEVKRGLGVASPGFEINNKIILDSKDGINVQVGVIARVDLVDDSGIVGVCDHEMNVGRAHWRAVHQVEEHTGRAIGRQGVRSRVIAVPVKLSLGIRLELAPKIVLGLCWVLKIVLSVGRGLPDIEDGSFDGGSGFQVLEDAVHVGGLALGVRVLDDAVAESTEGSVGRPEGTEDNVGGRGKTLFGDDLVGDLIDEAN